MSLPAAALKKRSFPLDCYFPVKELCSFQPKEKRTRTTTDCTKEIFDGLKDSFESFSNLSSVQQDCQENMFPSDIDLTLMKDNNEWMFDFPQNLLSSLTDNDSLISSPTIPLYDETNSNQNSETSYFITCNDHQTSLTSQHSHNCHGYDFSINQSSIDTFYHHHQQQQQQQQTPNNEFFDNISINLEESLNSKRIPPPPYQDSEEFSEVDQKFHQNFETFKNIPNRPTTLKLATHQFGLITEDGLPGTSISEIASPSRLIPNFQCSGDLIDRKTNFRKLPMMQSFLNKSPMTVNTNLLTSQISTSSLPFDSISSMKNLPFDTPRPHDYGNATSLYHQNFLTISPYGTPPSNVIEPKIATSPDAAYSPTTPSILSNPSSNICTWSNSIMQVDSGPNYSDNQLYALTSDYRCNNHPFELNSVQFNNKVEETKTTGLNASNKTYSNNVNHAKECSTVETKTPTHILQALMKKIMRNQTVKSQTQNCSNDIIRNIEKKGFDDVQTNKLNSSLESINVLGNGNVIVSEKHIIPDEGSFQSIKRSRFNSCSNFKVTVGEADTSDENCPLSHDKKKRHKVCKTDTEELHTYHPMPRMLRNTNYLESFMFHLNAPISSIKKSDKDLRITYLNKGQYYILSMDCTSNHLRTSQATLKTIVMILFQDPSLVGHELNAWVTWHNKQQSFKQRILDVDFKNTSSGRPQEIDEIAFNATSVVWKANCSNITINTAVNCLSTDFSNQKGVKGIPLLMQLDTYLDEELIHRAHCHIKVFCDKGAERKVRDEEKKNKESKLIPDELLNLPSSSTSPQLPLSNFHLSEDFSKLPLLFTPKPNVPFKTSTKSSRTFGSLFKSECQDFHPEVTKNQTKADKITLFVKEEEEEAFNELVLVSPTVQGLLEAIASKCNLGKESIKNIYKKSKKGILVKIDDQVIRHYANESAYIVHTRQSSIASSSATYDVTLQEIG